MDDAQRVLVVDAANVVGSRADGWWKDRAGAARRLLGELAELATRLPESTELIVVLEGAAKRAVDGTEPSAPRMTVVPADGSGDDTIVEVVSASKTHDITVVTADRELRSRVEAHGAATVGPTWLRDQLT
ncbi:NYN domain-containing protein [Nocardia neocaledoniensis]|uniref:NYN domain-containing protein n=1 Tax=Nocardia neocaledoniensis TaxID=236511 RepID=UPI0024562513|nr:NYN domain-containing protein [Nocardia neocaledoniensis]